MRRLPIVLILAVAAVLAACGSSSTPGWTYAPPTEAPASVAPSGDASAPPASEAPASEAPASEAPSGEAPSGDAGGAITLTASGINWVEKELTSPADAPFVLRLDNQDNGVPHDVVIKDGTGAEVKRSEIITGIAQVELDVPALAPGAYTYVCSIHPNMTGTLTAGG